MEHLSYIIPGDEDAPPCSNSTSWMQQREDEKEDDRDAALRRYSYGVALPAICCLGIIGNVLNLVVLTRRNMRGTAYTYMRATCNPLDVIRVLRPYPRHLWQRRGFGLSDNYITSNGAAKDFVISGGFAWSTRGDVTSLRHNI